MLLWKRLEGQSGHAAAWQLLEEAYGCCRDGKLPEIRRTEQGKPYFLDSELHFSLSHTKRHAFCCLAEKNVGLDAEEADREISMRLAERWLSPSERGRLAGAEDPRTALLRLWVLKEAYSKLTGRGLGDYLKDTDFSPEDSRIHIIEGCFVAVLEEDDHAL